MTGGRKGKAVALIPAGPPPEELNLLIDAWRARTGRSFADLSDNTGVGVGYVLSAWKGVQVPLWVEKRIRAEVAP